MIEEYLKIANMVNLWDNGNFYGTPSRGRYQKSKEEKLERVKRTKEKKRIKKQKRK